MEVGKYLLALLVFYLALSIFSGYTLLGVLGTVENGNRDILRKGSVSLDGIKGTADSLSAVFEIEKIRNGGDAIATLVPTGTPEYGQRLGVSYDDPVSSLQRLSSMWESYSSDVRENNPEVWERFMNLASRPVGISCEFCCGVGAVGIDKNGRSICGCQHNPALLSLTLWLMENTDMDDKEVLAEVLRWKTLFFPRDMVSLAMRAAGGEITGELPQMVGGC